MQFRPSQPLPSPPQQSLQEGKGPILETLLARYIQVNDVRLTGQDELLRNQQATLQMFEHQVS